MWLLITTSEKQYNSQVTVTSSKYALQQKSGLLNIRQKRCSVMSMFMCRRMGLVEVYEKNHEKTPRNTSEQVSRIFYLLF